MSHAFSVNAVIGASAYFSLAPFANDSDTQSDQIYKAGRVRVSLAGITGGGTAADGLLAHVRFVTLSSQPSSPGPSLQIPAPGTALNNFELSTRTGQTSIEVGQPYQKGFSADAQGKAVATHVLIEGVIGDSNTNLVLNIEVD